MASEVSRLGMGEPPVQVFTNHPDCLFAGHDYPRGIKELPVSWNLYTQQLVSQTVFSILDIDKHLIRN